MVKEQETVALLSKGIGSRITQIRATRTQQVFAESIGISKTSLIRYEKEERIPDAEIMAHICKQYHVDLNWLVTGQGKQYRFESLRLKQIEQPEEEQEPDCIKIPKYDIGASAGPGSFVDDYEETEWIAVDLKWLRRELKVNPLDVSMIHVRGDSMQPTIVDKDMLLVTSVVEQIRDGIYVLRYDGLLQVKRLQRLPKGMVRVTSDNASYEPFTVDLQDGGTDFVVVGRVVWVGRKLGY